MIPLLFTNIPVTYEYKLQKLVEKVIAAYGSEYYNVQGQYWKGDQLTIESIFPDYILKEYETDPTKVKIIPLIKNYLRWLFSLDYGYGAYLNWETIRSGTQIENKLLEGLAEFYFPEEDFASDNLKDILPNIKKFSINCDSNYFDIKGTEQAIFYILVTLLGSTYNTTKVQTYTNCTIKITSDIDSKYYEFIQRSVIPAGMRVIYEIPEIS